MNTNETIRIDTQDDVIELGIASLETQGADTGFEAVGKIPDLGISAE